MKKVIIINKPDEIQNMETFNKWAKQKQILLPSLEDFEFVFKQTTF